MTPGEAILKDLVQGPYDGQWLSEAIWCVFCGADRTVHDDPHAPDCLWLRARRLVEGGK